MQLAFGSAFLVLPVVGVISYRGMVLSEDSGRWVRHTQVRELQHEALRESW